MKPGQAEQQQAEPRSSRRNPKAAAAAAAAGRIQQDKSKNGTAEALVHNPNAASGIDKYWSIGR